MRIKLFVMTVISFMAVIQACPAAALEAGTLRFAIVFPGGPSAGGEGQKMIGQFLDHLAGKAGLSRKMIEGRYFTDTAQAARYVSEGKGAYVLGPTSFFLANRSALKLKPLALMSIDGKDSGCYYVVVKKGKYDVLAALKGKVLSGNVLYEDARFLDSVVFGGRLSCAKYFNCKPTLRPLSALRQLGEGKIDAVILNEMQYASLSKMRMSDDIMAVYISEPVPTLGLMAAESPAAAKVEGRVLDAAEAMCGLDEGRDVCRNFGIQRFVRTDAGRLNEVIARYK